MNIDETDFYKICLEESPDFYDRIFAEDKNDFNQWIRENLSEFITIDCYDSVLPDATSLSDLIKVGYQHEHFQCHYSAKAVSILNEEYNYVTGFVERNTNYYSILTHSFNLYNDKIVDFARVDDTDSTLFNYETSFPHIYYGIEIPREFLIHFQDATLNEKSMNPLLIDWYLKTKN
jgi:hypothetical protein